jgi:hypothetical protein
LIDVTHHWIPTFITDEKELDIRARGDAIHHRIIIFHFPAEKQGSHKARPGRPNFEAEQEFPLFATILKDPGMLINEFFGERV